MTRVHKKQWLREEKKKKPLKNSNLMSVMFANYDLNTSNNYILIDHEIIQSRNEMRQNKKSKHIIANIVVEDMLIRTL